MIIFFSFISVSLDRQIAGSVRLDRDFDPELNDPKSAKSIELKNEFTGPLKNAFCGSSTTCSFRITSFSEGSIIINFLLGLASGQASGCDALSNLNSLINNVAAIPGISSGSLSQGKL